MHIDLIVLNGAYGRTLAFGPGYSESSAFPGSPGTTILTGHRDTHFYFLRGLKRHDEIVIDTPDGSSRRYRVVERRIVDARTDSIRLSEEGGALILVTCYPFDSVVPGGPLRYLVMAIPVPSTRPRSIEASR
jgi:sortase A